MTHRILHVEDTPAALYARSRLLKQSGYEVMEATTGREALQKLTEGRPELMLIDVNLPDISGLEICQHVRQDPGLRHMPVIQISALNVDDIDAAYGVSSGADFYITEPVRGESLLLVIKALLERRQLQERAEQDAAGDAARARRVHDDTLTTLGHELRDPLHAMSTWLSVLRDPHITQAQRNRALDRVQRAVAAQSAIVDDLLDIARINAGALSLDFAPMSLEHTVMTAIEDMQAALIDKNINMCIASDGPVWIRGDASRIGQAVRSLLDYALRFTAVGGNVTVSCRKAGAEAELCISDDGAGIAAELLPQVFEPSRPAERIDSEPQAALGLGLAIAAHVVQQHGGRIAVASADRGQGATVTVRFPAIAPR